MADSGFRAPNGPPGSWTTIGNEYNYIRKVIGNGKRRDDNSQVTLVIDYAGLVDTDWSGNVGDIVLSKTVLHEGSANSHLATG